MKIYYDHKLKEKSRKLRNNLTVAEGMLWARLQRKQLCGVRFVRQKPIDQFIADFYCPKGKLVIELDGPSHNEPGAADEDKIKQERFETLGLKVLRFSNADVRTNLDAVIAEITDVLNQRLS